MGGTGKGGGVRSATVGTPMGLSFLIALADANR